MKRCLVVFFVMLTLFFFPASVVAQTNQPEEEQAAITAFENLPTEELTGYWEMLSDKYGDYIPELEKGSLLEFIRNQGDLSIESWLKGLFEYLLYELLLNGKLLGTLILLSLFSSILQTIQTAFNKGSISKVAYLIVSMVLLTLLLNSFRLSVNYAMEAINGMSDFMLALIPLLLGLMASFGSLTAVAFFHPIIVFLIHASGLLIAKVVIPLFLMSALLHLVSTINKEYPVTQLADLLKNIALWLLGIFFSVFLGVISVQGAVTAVQDGVAMKTAKFVTGNFIPVIGRMFTDATDTVLSASLLLKNAIGIVGVLIVLAIALFPAIKILAIALIYKIAAALLQPLGDGPIIKSMQVMSKFILYIFACLLVVAFMFFIAIVIIVASSNVTLMLR
ncbi:stage III sporulation protein AE [Terribacillus aidingensis]|uniref:Stage III sporulation protein AE n=1 Tax=Terribacillus aidingensis TaxID=586416 RepID=A0A285NMN4_9BACI|nr:stage III sporulation protein AE [Terribacillus aidingensis]SNZ10729.1 stage III sporulation protein AE [Terribacillus aidingensis]